MSKVENMKDQFNEFNDLNEFLSNIEIPESKDSTVKVMETPTPVTGDDELFDVVEPESEAKKEVIQEVDSREWWEKYDYTVDTTTNSIILSKYNGRDDVIYIYNTVKIYNGVYKVTLNGEVFRGKSNISEITIENEIGRAHV